jgi:PAS domain S-box-containing protein
VSTLEPVPLGETERLQALRRYEILDTAPEEAFDRVVQLAASLFAAPMACISFVDAEREWLKAATGVALCELPRAMALCAHTIMRSEPTIVADARKDPRFHDSPLVTGRPYIRFYAGAPIETRDGHRLGSLCVMDTEPRSNFSPENGSRLVALAGLVAGLLDFRSNLSEHERAERDLKLINELVAAVADAVSVKQALEAALRIIGEAVGAAHARACALGGSDGRSQLLAVWGTHGVTPPERVAGPRRARLTLANGIFGNVMRENRRLVVPDLAARGRRFPAADEALAAGLRSAVCIPLQEGEHRFALGFMFDHRPPDLEALADRIEEFGRKIAPGLSRKLAEERTALLQSVVRHANEGVLLAELHGARKRTGGEWRIVYATPATARITGYRPEELHGLALTSLWAEEMDASTRGKLRRIVEQGQSARFELACRRKNGAVFWAEVTAMPVLDDTTGERKLMAILRDRTERRRLEEALRQGEATFRLLFASNPIPMWVVDLESMRFLEVNDSAVERYGYGRPAFLDMTLDDIGAPGEAPPPLDIDAETGRLGTWQHRAQNGRIMTVELVGHRLEFRGHEAAIIAAIDMTDQKRIEEESSKAREAAEAANRAKTELLTNMSHELRTPLNAIIGFSEIMSEKLFGPLGSAKYEGYVADIRHSAAHLLMVITDILDLAKIEANSFELDENLVETGTIINSALRLVKPRANRGGVKLHYEQRHGEVVIRADELALKRVLINLLSNAVKFSHHATTVTVRSEFNADGALVIAIADQGIGMAPEEIPIALTPFRQISSGLQRRYEGTGLGLPIAKELVEMHGGTLSIESQRRVGTTVTIVLPTARVLAAA